MTIASRLEDTWTRGVALLAGRTHEQRLDYCLAACIALALELEVFTSGHLRGPLVQNTLAVAVMALGVAWRRRSPLMFLVVVGIAALSLSRGSTMTSTSSATLADLFCIVFPTYTIGAWERRNRAIIGFLVWIPFAIGIVAVQHLSGANLLPATLTALAAWIAGRVMHSQRTLESELQLQLRQLADERADRACLAAAGERMRIARELDEVVAHSVVGMVLQAEAAERLLDEDEAKMDVALATVENTGRSALVEMRRILGVIRRPEDTRDLEPQPGVGQIHALVQRNRGRGQPIDLHVVGDPRTLPAHIDFSIYRIMEEALDSACTDPTAALHVTLSFDQDLIELQIDAECRNSISWPTPAMSERVALCGGDLQADTNGNDCHLWARLPSRPRGVLT